MKSDLLFEDYKLRLDYLKGQYDRLWLRFSFFLTIELALFGFLSFLTFEKTVRDPRWLPALAGVGVSLLWWVVGAQDRYLVEEYRKRAAMTAAEFAQEGGLPGYRADHPAASVDSHWDHPWSWYWTPISVTRLPAIMATAFLAVWIGVIVCWPSVVACQRM